MDVQEQWKISMKSAQQVNIQSTSMINVNNLGEVKKLVYKVRFENDRRERFIWNIKSLH